MNKRTITLIIALLTIAIIALVGLQIDLTLATIRANEEAFDKNVHNAMSIVAEAVESASNDGDLLLVLNGYSKDYIQFNEDDDSNNGAMSIPIASGNIYDDKLLEEIRKEHNIPGVEQGTYDYVNDYKPIEDRIDEDKLKQVLAQELQNNAIKQSYRYAVFSHDKNDYVIQQKGFVDLSQSPQQNDAFSYYDVDELPYEVTLFERKDGTAAGKLKLYFPDKEAAIWKNLLPSFIGTFLLAAVILSCFAYTVWVIFRQKRVSEMKTDFINNMTHEFKTPIATISLAADSITNPKVFGDISKLRRFVNIIKQENKRMNNQVEKVLQMAKIDREESKLRLTELNLHEIVSSAVENIGLQVEKRQGTAKAILQAHNPIIEGDQTHVSNVINNLLDNANKYSPEAPQITVRTESVDKGVQLIISDKGMGLSKENRKHIFDRFYRVHTGDRHDVKGFGLGLSYVKAIVTAHKGTISVNSELGKGSDFILFFPYKQG